MIYDLRSEVWLARGDFTLVIRRETKGAAAKKASEEEEETPFCISRSAPKRERASERGEEASSLF